MEEKIHVNQKNTDVYNTFIEVCVCAANLRARLTSGLYFESLKNPYRDFRFNFDLLYTITCDTKDLLKNDDDLVTEVKKWMTCVDESGAPTKEVMLCGLDLFYRYKLKLVSYKIVNVGVT